jgi:hypothetical protein
MALTQGHLRGRNPAAKGLDVVCSHCRLRHWMRQLQPAWTVGKPRPCLWFARPFEPAKAGAPSAVARDPPPEVSAARGVTLPGTGPRLGKQSFGGGVSRVPD